MKDLIADDGWLMTADGEIEKITHSIDQLEIIFKDWRENRWLILIKEVVAFEAIDTIGEMLEDSMIEAQSDYKDNIFKMLDEEVDADARVFTFTSAWSDLHVLRVIGTSIETIPIQPYN